MTPSPFRSIGIGLAIDLTCGFELNHGKSCNNDCPSNPLRTYKYDVAVGMMITFYCPCQSRVMSGEASMLLVTRVVHYKCIGTWHYSTYFCLLLLLFIFVVLSSSSVFVTLVVNCTNYCIYTYIWSTILFVLFTLLYCSSRDSLFSFVLSTSVAATSFIDNDINHNDTTNNNISKSCHFTNKRKGLIECIVNVYLCKIF